MEIMEIDEPTSTNDGDKDHDDDTDGDGDDDEYEEEVSYIIIDLGTEVTLDMITNNFEILNNINPCSFNFNQSRHHQNQDPSSSNPQPSNSDPNNNDPNNQTASTSSSSKSFHHHLRPSTTGREKEIGGGEPSNPANKKENDDIDYSLIGLDTDTPYLRIGNIHFKGEYDETIGTDLIFFPEPDSMNPRQQKLTYQCQTTKRIKFSQVNLQEIDLNTTNKVNIEDDNNEWEDNYSISLGNDSLNDQELFNTKSDLEDDEDDGDGGNESGNQIEKIIYVVDKGKGKELDEMETGD